MGNDRKRRHHTVPHSLLVGFAEGTTLSAWRRKGDRHPVSTGDATVHRDFYAFVGQDGRVREDFENWLADEVEGPAAPALARARAGDQPTSADKVHLARLAGIGLLRTATARSYMEQIDPVMVKLMFTQQLISKRGLNPNALTPRDRLELAESANDLYEVFEGLTNPEDQQKSHLRTIARTFDTYATGFQNWTWTLT